MTSLFSLGVELLAAAMLLLLWFQDRTRTYLLWWAAAHTALPFLSASGGFFRETVTDFWLVGFCYVASATTMVVCQVQGVLCYRGVPLSRPRLLRLAGALLIVELAALFSLDVGIVRMLVAMSTTAAFAATAAVLWSPGRFEKITSMIFVMRAVLGAVAMIAIARGISVGAMAPMMSLSAFLVVASALSVVVMVFNRLLTDLREHSLFQTLSKEIVTALQGLMDEREMARRVIDLFIEHRKWDLGALALHEPGRLDFDVAYAAGVNLTPELQSRFKRLPFSGLSGIAFNSRRLVYSKDAANDLRLPGDLRATAREAGTATQIFIPLIHDDVALGVLILRDREERALLPHEIETMESLGRVIGMSLNHLRNLATMAFRATHDALTGLDNRAALHEWFAGQPVGGMSTLMLFDLNGFKEVNDSLGHSVGDELLQELSKRLQQSLASDHIKVFRLGGDEFVILYDDAVDDRENTRRAHRLAELIAQPFYIGGVCLRTSASIGIAEAPRHGKSSHELLRCADLAMYQAKNNGWSIAFYEQGRDEDVRDRMQLVSGVIDGLERGEFELYYQPLVDLRDGSCRGCEALLRWHHPQRGLLGAAAFMPFVEATDLIHPLTQRVADLAIRDAAAWQARGTPLKVSINLSARNLLDADLAEQLLRLTRQYKLDPTLLQLEVTETVLMKDPVSATAIMQRLRDAGFSMALDDFGTGYSSLAYLARFPIQTLKIDQSFVRNMLSDRRSRSIVQSTVELAHMLDLTVVAEGIENLAEAKLLREFKCDLAQGYHYTKPLCRSAFEDWWQARNTSGRHVHKADNTSRLFHKSRDI